MRLSCCDLDSSCRACILLLLVSLSLLPEPATAQSIDSVCSGHGVLSAQGICVCEPGYDSTNDGAACIAESPHQDHDHEAHGLEKQDDQHQEISSAELNGDPDDHDHDHHHDHDHSDHEDHEKECDGYGHIHDGVCACKAGYTSVNSNGTTCELDMAPSYFMDTLMAEYFNATTGRIHMEGMESLIDKLSTVANSAVDDKSCSGNGHWEITECHCDSGFTLSDDGRQCLASRRRRQTTESESPCLDSASLFELYEIDPEEGATESQFAANFTPAIVQMFESGACATPVTANANTNGDAKPSKSQAYLYSICAVLIISMTSLGGVLIIPILLRVPKAAKWVLMFLVALAVGTLVGDAIMHLLPIALGVHTHAEDGSMVVLTRNETIFRTITVCAGMFFFIVIEASLSACGLGNTHGHGIIPEDIVNLGETRATSAKTECDASHEHTHDTASNGSNTDTNRSSDDGITVTLVDTVDTALQIDNVDKKIAGADKINKTEKEAVDGTSLQSEQPYPEFTGWKNVANVTWCITIGDGVHNFVDGVAVGASFAVSTSVGISTAIAMVLHELPQEFGDFGIYLASGTGIKRALALNLGSGFTGLLGVVLGIEGGETWTPWILAFTAGMFLYIALVGMYPQLEGLKVTHSPDISNLVQMSAMLIGWSIMLLIAFTESH